jgi:L-2,4-diaminobutyrate transaminase
MPHGDILGFAPPLVMTPAEIDEMVTIATAAVKQMLDELSRAGGSIS